MANKGAKKRKEENLQHIRMLRYIILITNVFYVLVRLVIFRSSVSWTHYFGLLLTSGAYKLSYDQLAGMAKASYDDNGELIDGGFDMSTGGLCEYLHDILYITSFVQASSVISDKFWYIYLVIPLFAFYKLWQLVLYPFVFQQTKEEPEDEKSRRKREKMEKRAGKPKFAKLRSK
ncbi:hypothetical protein O6H91_15G040600 [Diphasiastrum complanatum]|uniref:Uncharacterized protein n=2 Tax=Diphasiastrum complanatum TaxID=34168 RepID=A0ACC2BHM9_DIPCM|nr:hypothetical protein O6H91_15G039500 [Diphasiastrum complanatum]KAJ7529263.1 hypothetical protein O6H91_15G040600 [Diphasiastrum complanatum]